MWKFNHDYLKYDLELTKYQLDGFSYQWYDGVFSVALGRRGKDGFRKAYFHPMASNSEFEVSTKVLQSEEASKRVDQGNDFKVCIGNDYYEMFARNGAAFCIHRKWETVEICRSQPYTIIINDPASYFSHKWQKMLSVVGILMSHALRKTTELSIRMTQLYTIRSI